MKNPLLLPVLVKDDDEETETKLDPLSNIDPVAPYKEPEDVLDDYQPLLEMDINTRMYIFFNKIGIEKQAIMAANISEPHLLKLFQKEVESRFNLSWSRIDHFIEELLYWFLLRPKEVGEAIPETACARIKLQQRSILLHSRWGLMKMYGIRGFIKGVETGLIKFLHYFIYTMLIYRLVYWMKNGENNNFEEFKNLFQNSNQRGIDSLIRVLARLDAAWLKSILIAPVIIGTLQGLSSLLSARKMTREEMRNIFGKITAHTTRPSYLWHDVIRESIPVLGQVNSLSAKIQKLERLVRWDGNLSSEDRLYCFSGIQLAAKKGHKIVKLNALECLAKIVDSIGLNDTFVLKTAGYDQATLLAILYSKTAALKDLELLSQQKLATILRRLYAVYLIWWLGLSTSFWKQKLPFFLFKMAKLAMEIYLLQKIIASILEAIRCPDKLGFELGFGYPEWATQFTTRCFLQLIENVFRTVNLNDSVDELIAQIPLFNLADLTGLIFSNKNLTGAEIVKILTAIAAKEAPLIKLSLYYNYITDTDIKDLSNYLDSSKIQILYLGCQLFSPGGEGLTNQGLQYLINVLPATQLSLLWLCIPDVNNTGVISLALELNSTEVTELHLINANIDDDAGILLAQAALVTPLERMSVVGSRIGDGTIQAFAPVLQKSTVLIELFISGNFISDEGAQSFAQMIQSSRLESVGLLSSNITDTGIIAFSDSLTKLSSLTYFVSIGSYCGEKGLTTLAQQLNQTQFTWIDLIGYGSVLTVNSIRAFSKALPQTLITDYYWIDYQFDNEVSTELTIGVKSSKVTTLSFSGIKFSDSMAALTPAIAVLKNLQFVACNLRDEDLIILAQHLPGTALQGLYLGRNNIGDKGVLALAEVLSDTNIKALSLYGNNITDIGAKALADIYPSTRLEILYLYENEISSDILSRIESFQWKIYCQDQLCHANTRYNDYSADVRSNAPFDFSSTEIWSQQLNTLALPAPDPSRESEETSFTQNGLGTMIISIAVIGTLVYKNLPMIRTIIDTGVRMLESCFYRNSNQQPLPSVYQKPNHPYLFFSHSKDTPVSSPTLPFNYS